MKRRRKALLLILAAVFFTGSIAAAYAAVETQTGIKNTVSTGGISIDIDTFTVKDGNTVPLEGKTVIDRDKAISYIPRIKNNAEDCYIRVSVSAASASDLQEVDLIKEITDLSPDWKLTGGYLYYTKPLKHDQTVDLCSGFHMPKDWDYMKSNDLCVKITADAIQTKHFNPDFELDNPWGDVEVRSSAVGDDYVINTVDPSETKGNIKVVYANAVDGITINTDDFFSDVKFMPGDEYSDSLTVSNKTKKKATVLFKTEFEDSPLLDMMQLKINNGTAFYDGPMASDSLTEYQKIASLSPGEIKNIDVKLALPKEAANSYQVNSDQVKWYFAIEQETKGIKTDDGMCLGFASAIMLITAAGMFLAARRGKKDEESI